MIMRIIAKMVVLLTGEAGDGVTQTTLRIIWAMVKIAVSFKIGASKPAKDIKAIGRLSECAADNTRNAPAFRKIAEMVREPRVIASRNCLF